MTVVWSEPEIQACRCPNCFRGKLYIQLFGRLLFRHPMGHWEVGEERPEDDESNYVFYEKEKIAGPFRDLFEIDAWIERYIKVDNEPNAHINALMRKL